MPILSLCVPTYNRCYYLENLLESITNNLNIKNLEFEICISDNNSTDETFTVIENYSNKIKINYNKNSSNIGATKNYLKVIEMAKGDFVWLIGDDDLIMPNALNDIINSIKINKSSDFFFVNSYQLNSSYIEKFSHPFSTDNLPIKMKRVSNFTKNANVPFFDLINSDVTFDFLGGIFLSVFRRQMWLDNTKHLNQFAINDNRCFSHFDNTFPHIKIFSNAFAKSSAVILHDPMSICLSGVREWASMNSFVQSIRLNEALDVYRSNGLPINQYLRLKNYSLRNFIPDLAIMIMNRRESGIKYIKFYRFFIKNCFYPNLYFSFFYYFIKKIKVTYNVSINL